MAIMNPMSMKEVMSYIEKCKADGFSTGVIFYSKYRRSSAEYITEKLSSLGYEAVLGRIFDWKIPEENRGFSVTVNTEVKMRKSNRIKQTSNQPIYDDEYEILKAITLATKYGNNALKCRVERSGAEKLSSRISTFGYKNSVVTRDPGDKKYLYIYW